jgi:hypothetical protein
MLNDEVGLALPPGLRPEVAARLLEQAEEEERSRPRPTMDEAIESYIRRIGRDEENLRLARKIREENQELFALLGER